MMDCRETLKRLYDYLDRELTPIETNDVRDHLERCRGCFDRYEFENKFGKYLATEGQETVETAGLKEKISARLRQMEDAGPAAGEELFPDHADHASIDDVPLPEPHPAGAGEPMGRRIPLWSYVLAAAALLMVAIPLMRRDGTTTDVQAALEPFVEMHKTAVMQISDPDPRHLADWLDERVQFDPMVQKFELAGCALSGAAVDSIWAVLFAESGGVPVCVMVTEMTSYDIHPDMQRVEMNGREFWTATDGQYAVVIWAWHPTGVVCAAVAEADTDYLLQLANRVEDAIEGV